MTFARILLAAAGLLLLGCFELVTPDDGSVSTGTETPGGKADDGDGDGGVGGSGGEQAFYPLVVQRSEAEGFRNLIFATLSLTCDTYYPYPAELIECDDYLLTVLVPEWKLVSGAVLEYGVDGVIIEGAESAPPHKPDSDSCSGAHGAIGWGGRIELLKVSDKITARLVGFEPEFYEGTVDGTYVGDICPTDVEP